MKVFENIKNAFIAIWANKFRSFLTMLGIIIGVFAVITLVALAQGVKNEITKQIENFGSNLVIIVPGKVEEGKSFNPTSSIGSNSLSLDDEKEIREKVSEVKYITPIMLMSGIVKKDDKQSSSTIVLGVNQYFKEVTDTEIGKGNFFGDDEMNNKSKVVVIGSLTKDNLFGEEDPIGKEIMINKDEFEIIGVVKEEQENLQFGMTSFNDIALMPDTTLKDITGNGQIIRIFAEAQDSDAIDKAAERVKEVMKARRNGEEDFSVMKQDDILSMMGSILNILTSMLAGIAAISLIVGGIGIMNIMLVSVTERTKEIGIRKAIGATNGDILIQFLTESIVISFMGGAIGIALAIIGSQILSSQIGLTASVTLNAILLAVGVSAVVGVFFGVAPAIRASRLDPIEALRYE